ncbi:hypothetical protein D3C83_10850 [compost metagenome]
MVTDVTKNRTSSDGTRSLSSTSASRSGRPKFCWSNAFLNSAPTGSGSSSATIPIAVWNACPARMARDSRSSASGNCSSNRRMRRERLCASQANGMATPTSAAGMATRTMRVTMSAITTATMPETRLIPTTAPGVVVTPDCSMRRVRRGPACVRAIRCSTIGSGPSAARITTVVLSPPSSTAGPETSRSRCSTWRFASHAFRKRAER